MRLKKEKSNFIYDTNDKEDISEVTEDEKKAKNREIIIISLLVLISGLFLIPLIIFLYNWRVLG